MYSTFPEEEHENMDHQETSHDIEATKNKEDMDYYCKQFGDFMQAHPHQKYDLISSRKISRDPEQQEGTSPQVIPPVPNKGKGKLNPNSSKIKLSTNKEGNSSKGHAKKEAPILQKTANGKEGEAEPGGIEIVEPTFNIQKELEKVKIHVPLIELLKKPTYKAQVSQFMHFSTSSPAHDNLNLQEERPTVFFRLHVNKLDPSTAPFYVTLVIHDLLLHNCMLDSGASHNLMALEVMERLGLQITRPYKDLYSFDSKRVKCLGKIKYLVVAYIPPQFNMLLSRSWGSKVGGSIKLDPTYATIITFGGEQRRLYRESRFVKTVTPAKGSENSPMHGKESNISCMFLEEDETILAEILVHLTRQLEHQNANENEVWKLYFDGANSKEGNGAGVLLVSPEGILIPLSFKLEFEAPNNVVTYEAFLLGLQMEKNIIIECLMVYEDSELVIR